jgi:HD-GYP domain-containing protein (c-di-GMP phosphodiesterase class II)
MPFGFRDRRGERAVLPVAAQGGESSARDAAAPLDLTDEEMKGTTRQIVDLTVRVGRAMGMAEQDLKNARLGAFLHDIGMISVPDDILFKDGPLTEQEWQVVREHPTYGHELLSRIPAFAEAMEIPYCHHEKWGRHRVSPRPQGGPDSVVRADLRRRGCVGCAAIRATVSENVDGG